MSMYPLKVTLYSPKLLKMLTEKGELIKTGIQKSEEIEKIEAEMQTIDEKIQEQEKLVDITDIQEKQKEISAIVDDCITKMEDLKKEIYDRMMSQVPKELHDEYDILKKNKETAETERNKIAIKAQKYTDKIIPLARKLMEPHLADKYDDYDSIRVEDGEITATIFNHVDEFKKRFNKKDARKELEK